MSRMKPPIRTITLLVLTLVACDDSPTDPRPLDAPALSPAIQWAGGTVRVTAPTIDSADVAPSLGVSLDPEDLEVVAVGDGWADYRLPMSARGPIELVLGGEQPDTFEIQILGFRGAHSLDVALRGNLFVWPHTGEASVLGIASDDSGIIQVLPGALATRYLLEMPIFDNARSVGRTADPDVLLIPTGYAEVWRVRPTLERLDSIAVPFARHAMLLSDSVYVASWHHAIDVYDPRSTGPMLYSGMYEETQGMVVSPSGRYGAVEINGSALGVPVFSGENGEPVFHVDMMSHSDGIDFSPVGDTLYLAGMRRIEPRDHLVLAIDATTGAVVNTLEIADFNPRTLRRDPNGPWLFVLATMYGDPAEQAVMLVIDSRTMQLVGTVATEGFAGCAGYAGYACQGAITVGPEGVFFVSNNSHPANVPDVPATVLAFDGWPLE